MSAGATRRPRPPATAPPAALPVALAIVLAGGLLLGCGGGSPQLEISAAASLRGPFTAYAKRFTAASVRYSFAGSDTLAAQIQQGARPDVFASANTELPVQLYDEGLTERPVVFAVNRLVLAVPASSPFNSLADAERPGVTIALGSPTVPVGAYSERVLARLPPAQSHAFLANVRDREPDVTGIVGKLLEGAVDAALVYDTDVVATAGRLRAIELPASLEPRIAYGAAVVRGSGHEVQARAFLAGLLRGAGRTALLAAGFRAPHARADSSATAPSSTP